ncbi:MAG: arginine--tRNA ligase, partial [Actinomycetota bacterium]
MIQDDLRELISNGIEALRTDGVVSTETPDIQLERPARSEHGHFSTNIALVMARDAGTSPRQLAETLVPMIPQSKLVDKTEIAGPGFINFYLSNEWLHATVREIATAKQAYGRTDTGANERISVEFVSANPTGPLHAGAGRNAALGHALANLLEAVGHQVWREYYINDTGNQLDRFARSIEARYRQALGHDVAVPEDGYQGNYLIEMGRKLAEAEAMGMIGKLDEITEWALEESVASHQASLSRFGVHFDEWFKETSLHESGAVQAAIDQLIESGHTFESEGAVWFRSRDGGGTRDQVVVRSNGTPTYLAADIAYLLNKCERGFDKALYLWGADHHGNVESLLAAARL